MNNPIKNNIKNIYVIDNRCKDAVPYTTGDKMNNHYGSDFDDYLRTENQLAEAEAIAMRRINEYREMQICLAMLEFQIESWRQICRKRNLAFNGIIRSDI